MNPAQLVFEAISSLFSNKMRSLLTILGIVIGVAAVISMVSLGRGVQAAMNDQLAGIGTNQLYIMATYDSSIPDPQPLTTGDMEALENPMNVQSVRGVTAVLSSSGTASYGSQEVSNTIYGVSANYGDLNDYELAEGRFINEEDVSGQAAVVVIGYDSARKLFNRQTGIVGEVIRLQGQPYRVVGVLESQGDSMVSTTPGDSSYLVPISTAQIRLMPVTPQDTVEQLNVFFENATDLDIVYEQVGQVLRERHNTRVGMDDFYIFVPQQLVDTLNQITGVMTIFLGGIAAISLLVGGIGIMNIMLVSVTERTREIGLRKAIGASRGDILIQFLTESAVLSLVGGILGIILGWVIGIVISAVAQNSGSDFTVSVSADAVLLATLFSTAIGLFFGFYPANRAASLTPVEALRSE